MKSFAHEGLASRVVFGPGAVAQVVEALSRLGARRALVIATPGHGAELARDVARRLGSNAAGICDQAKMHVPWEIAEEARKLARALEADCCVAIGGGSSIGLAKAVALTSSLPILAIPTTFSGSEMTPIYGYTEGGQKRTGRDPRALPKTVIYDPELLLALPVEIAGPSGMNALAHAVEALYTKEANPLVALLAEEAIRVLSTSLRALAARPQDLGPRSDALYGAWLAGICLGTVGMALHHKLCHVLGGAFDLPHAEMHTIVLPHSVAYNRLAAPEAMRIAARALGALDPALALYDLAKAIGAKLALADIGMAERGLERAAALAVENRYFNPRPIEQGPVLELLRRAFRGEPPEA